MAATGYASLQWNPDWERAVDRVAAGGKVDVLGLSLWKARYMLEVGAYHDARQRMMERYPKRWPKMPYRLMAGVIDQCLHEYLAPFCRVCLGAKEMIIDKKRVLCSKCEGSGLRRYSDSDRARGMKCSLVEIAKKAAPKFECIMGELTWMDAEVNRQMVAELEREGVDTKPFVASVRFQQEKSRLPVAEHP